MEKDIKMHCSKGDGDHKTSSESLHCNGSQADSKWLICHDDW